MPSRHNRNARKNNSNNSNNDHTRIYQQPTPSSRPSPDAYPSPLPDESPANSSTDDLHSRGRERGLVRPELQPEYQDSGGRLLAVSHSSPPYSLPTPPTIPVLDDDSAVAWNLEEGDPDEGVSSRPSTTPSSKPNSNDNSALSSAVGSSVASPSSSNPVSPSMRSVALGKAVDALAVPTAMYAPLSIGSSSPSRKGKKKKQSSKTPSESSSSSVSSSPLPRSELQPPSSSSSSAHRVQPHIEMPVQLQVQERVAVEEEEEELGLGFGNQASSQAQKYLPPIHAAMIDMDDDVEEDGGDMKGVLGLTGFNNNNSDNSDLVDLNNDDNNNNGFSEGVGGVVDDMFGGSSDGDSRGVGMALGGSRGRSGSGIGSGSGGGSMSMSGGGSGSNSMEGTIRPSKMRRGAGHERASVPDYEAVVEDEYGFGNRGVEVRGGGGGEGREVGKMGYESTSRRQSQPQTHTHSEGSGLSQAIGRGIWRDGAAAGTVGAGRGEDVVGGGPVERSKYPHQQRQQRRVSLNREREPSNPSLLSRPISRTVSQGYGAPSPPGGITSGLSSPTGFGLGLNPEGRVRVPSHVSSNPGTSRHNSNTGIPAVANGGVDEGDVILWARWDESLSGKRLLFLAYHSSGLQIWDCTDLGSIVEVLNLPSLSSSTMPPSASGSLEDLDMSKMAFEYAGIIPRPTVGPFGKEEDFLGLEGGDADGKGLWPLAGILVSPLDNDIEHDNNEHAVVDQDATDVSSALVVYSLAKHCVVKSVRLPGLAFGGGRFEVGQGTIVVSTTQPPALHILSTSTFKVLYSIPETALSTFCHKPPLRSPSSSGALNAHSRSTSLSSPTATQRHSFLSTTSNIVNGIYNNYNDHFNNDIYSNKHNNKIHTSDRNNVLLNTVDDDSFSTSPGYPYHPYQRPTHEDNNSPRSRTSTAGFSESSTIPSTTIPDPVMLPAPVFSLSSRLLAYASPTPFNTDSNVASIHPLSANATRTRGSIALSYSSTLSDAAVSTASAFGSTLSAQLANLGGNNAGGSAALGALSGIGQMSQADLGNAALKVGGSVLSGMKNLGGLAYKGAIAAASGNNSASSGSGSKSGMSAFANKFFSRSAPAASEGVRDRSFSTSSASSAGFEEVDSGRSGVTPDNPEDRSSVLPKTILSTENGYYVTVVDLSSLVDASESAAQFTAAPSSGKANNPTVISRFITSRFQPVSDIWFSQDGTSVLVAPRDGQVVQAFGLRTNPVPRMTQDQSESRSKSVPGSRSKTSTDRPSSSVSRPTSSNGSGQSSPVAEVPPLHVYNLRRGRTPAVIESASWADDGRWVALSTRKRTVHIFAVNPYGGKTDVRSHVEGKVRNYLEPPPLSTELSPLVRLRVSKIPGSEQPQVPLAFVFLKPSPVAESSMPTNLLPPITSPLLPPAQGHSYGSVSSTHTVTSSSPSTRSEPISPHFSPGTGRPKNYQDILVFDPTDGVLSLRRLMTDIKVRSKDGSFILSTSFGSFASVGSVGSTSRSLPGTGAAGRLSTSPNKASLGGSNSSGLTQMIEEPKEIIGKESTVATWSLRRRREWSETRKPLEDPSVQSLEQSVNLEDSARTAGAGRTSKVDWLARAELSTCSKMTKVLPRSVYLSHQFSFHALGEDYHALIRRYHFDIPGPKIEVRKGIEVSAYPSGTSESFVEAGGFATRHDARRVSASFDEPLASALAGGLDYSSRQPVLPMLPNGMPGSKPHSFKNPIPIRRMGDNAAEGLGRLRREINKVRSPRLPATSDSSIPASVSLEFDEEDEDFLDRNNDYPDVATARADVKHSVSPPATDDGTTSSTLESNDLSPGEDTSNDNAFEGWVGQDQLAGEELESFDHISAVGFLDEEQEMQAQAQAQAQVQAAIKSKKGKKGRRS